MFASILKWNEEAHPSAPSGRFASKAGAGGKKKNLLTKTKDYLELVKTYNRSKKPRIKDILRYSLYSIFKEEALEPVHLSSLGHIGYGQVLKANPNHAPAGNPQGGEFTHSPGKGVFLPVASLNAEQQARLKALKVPPKVNNVRLNEDPKAPLQVRWTDSKGREVRLYSAEHSSAAADSKWARVKEFHKSGVAFKVMANARKAMENPKLSLEERDAAACITLIAKTGFRIGSERDTGGESEAFGASTLEAKHVKIEGGNLTFTFPGKHGVAITKKLYSPSEAKYIANKLATMKLDDKLFNVTDARVRLLFKKYGGDKYKIKDFRTWQATAQAIKVVKEEGTPTTLTQAKKIRAKVGKVVSAFLGNTPTVALGSYVPPFIFDEWGPFAHAFKADMEKRESEGREFESWVKIMDHAVATVFYDTDKELLHYEVEKSFSAIFKFNPNHDKSGRFASSPGGKGVWPEGKSPWAKDMVSKPVSITPKKYLSTEAVKEIDRLLAEFKPKEPPPRPEEVVQPGVKTEDDLLAQAQVGHKELNSLLTDIRQSLGVRETHHTTTDEEFGTAMDAIRGKDGIFYLMGGIKSKVRLEEKVATDYAGDFAKAADVVRATIVVQTLSEVTKVLQELQSGGAVLARQPVNRFGTPTDEGYRDVKLNLTMPSGHAAELQINTIPMMDAKAKAHPLYKIERTIKGGATKEKRNFTSDEKKEYDDLVEQQRAIYEPAWKAMGGE